MQAWLIATGQLGEFLAVAGLAFLEAVACGSAEYVERRLQAVGFAVSNVPAHPASPALE